MKEKKKISKKQLIIYVAAAFLLALAVFFAAISVSAEDISRYETDTTVIAPDDEDVYYNDTETEGEGEQNTVESKQAGSENEANLTKSSDTYEDFTDDAAENVSDTTSASRSENDAEDIGDTASSGVNSPDSQPNSTQDGAEEKKEIILSSDNIFEEIYRLLEANADKIFSILAFVGTIVVSIGYKSGLLPLLRDALSKLKGSIDKVKEDNDTSNRTTGEKIGNIDTQIAEINSSLVKATEEIGRIQWQFEGYEEMCREREAMRVIIRNQIDMLYAIFMSSALPQYQKDEIGEKISQMKEELEVYGKAEK